jgi:hypothetical protein
MNRPAGEASYSAGEPTHTSSGTTYTPHSYAPAAQSGAGGQVITPAIRHAMTYNARPGGIHISTDYFAGHYGRDHRFHFDGWNAACAACNFTVVGGEWYFNWSGGNFGVVAPIPGYWALATDALYIDIGGDGNYYLYDTQFPGVAVQLTFVQNPGDDQAGADQDTGDGGGE